MITLEQEVAELLMGNRMISEHWDEALEKAGEIILLVGRRLEDEGRAGKEPDWHIVGITENFVDQADCNSGKRRRVYRDGRIVER